MSVRTGGQIIAGTTALVDATPTMNSPRPVSSGGVYDTCANRSATNFNNVGLQFLSGVDLPGSYYEELTVLASGAQYVAPANGWFLCNGILNTATSSALNRIYLLIRDSRNTSIIKAASMINGAVSGYRLYTFVPALKGDIVTVTNQSTASNPSWNLYFLYAEGQPHISPTYTPIEYIEGITNTQYIDTRLLFLVSSMNIYAKIGYVSGNTELNLGARNSTYGGLLMSVRSTSVVVDWFGTSASTRWTQPITISANDIYELSIENNVGELKQNGNIIGTNTFTPSDGSIAYPIYLNAFNNAGTVVSSNNVGRVYAFKAWDANNVLLRDMIPVLDENNVPCMYDSITDMLYYNSGTGLFTPGPILNS